MEMPDPKMTMDEYLEWEVKQAERHEYFQGEVFLMTGTTKEHNRAVRNICRSIEDQLDGTPCRVFTESVKVMLKEGFLYPDVVVICTDDTDSNSLFITEPVLIVEVLSPGIESYDRGKKFAMYRTIVTLREYVLIDADRRSVETFTRNGNGQWLLDDQTGVDIIQVTSLGLTLSAAAVFKGTG